MVPTDRRMSKLRQMDRRRLEGFVDNAESNYTKGVTGAERSDTKESKAPATKPRPW